VSLLDVIPCSLLGMYRHFVGTYRLRVHGQQSKQGGNAAHGMGKGNQGVEWEVYPKSWSHVLECTVSHPRRP